MPSLADEIDGLRRKFIAVHHDEMGLATALKERVAASDAALLEEVQSILDGHEARRAGIMRALAKLASRIGFVPRVSTPAPEPENILPSAVSLPGLIATRGAFDQATGHYDGGMH